MSSRPPPSIWLFAALMAGVYALNMMNQVALPFLASPIADDLRLSNTELGLLLGLSYAAVSAVLSVPVAWAADRISRSVVAGGGLALMGVASVLMGFGGSFGTLLAGRALAGVGDSGIVAAAMSLVSRRADQASRPAAIAIFNAGSSAGVIIAAIGLSLLVERIGWRQTLVLLGAVSLVAGLLVAAAVRDLRKGSDEASPDLRSALSHLCRVKTYRTVLLAFTTAGLTIGSVIAWNMRAFQSSFGMGQVEAGYLVAGAGAANLAGLLAYGMLAQRLRRRSAAAPLRLGAAMVLVGAVLGTAAYLSHGGRALVPLFLLSQLFLTVFQASLFTTALEVTPPSVGASATASMGFLFAFVGQGVGPFAVGMLVDFLEPSLGMSALPFTLAALTLAGGLAIAALMLLASMNLLDDLWDERRR